LSLSRDRYEPALTKDAQGLETPGWSKPLTLTSSPAGYVIRFGVQERNDLATVRVDRDVAHR